MGRIRRASKQKELQFRDILFMMLAIVGWIGVSIPIYWALFMGLDYYAIRYNAFNEMYFEILLFTGITVFMIFYVIKRIKTF